MTEIPPSFLGNCWQMLRPPLEGRRQSAAFKSGRGSEGPFRSGGVPRLSSTEMDTEVHGGVPPPGVLHQAGVGGRAQTTKVVFLLETSIKLQKKVVVLPRREHREVSHARTESLLFFRIEGCTVLFAGFSVAEHVGHFTC